jgi:hypothetical protein
MIALRLFAIFSLIAVNGFFAAVEISLVAVRLSWVRQMVKQGDPRARIVELLVAWRWATWVKSRSRTCCARCWNGFPAATQPFWRIA